jgi:3-deoxy-D-manno-octulosonic acid kinase
VDRRLPAGYSEERERGAYVVALPSAMEPVLHAVRSAGSLYDWASAQPGVRAFTGRGAAYGVGSGDQEWVVRHFRRGGLMARLLGDRYLRAGTPRPLSELRASAAARERGVATPEVVAVVVHRAGPFYRADIATRLVPGGIDLADMLLGPARPDAAGREAACGAAAELLLQAFDAGVQHADLNLRNILVQARQEGPRAYLLDLDRAVVHGRPATRGERRRMLQRLQRSRRKLERHFGTTAPEADVLMELCARGVEGSSILG